MHVITRQEEPHDIPKIADVIRKAFKGVGHSDHREHLMVDRLRNSAAFVPELSILAESSHGIVGHIMLTKVLIRNSASFSVSLALAPLSVLPEFQRQGIGRTLIVEAHRRAKQLGFQTVIVRGHADYYPKFGYERMKDHDIRLPFDVHESNCMVASLLDGEFPQLSGVVEYPPEFMEQNPFITR